MHSETTDRYRRVSFCLLMVLSLGRKSSYPASDCCQLTRYDLLNEREIAESLIELGSVLMSQLLVSVGQTDERRV